MLAALRDNPILAWTQEHYEKPVVLADTAFGRSAVVCDPAAIRRILVGNVGNYRKDPLQKRLLCPALGNGLLTSEGSEWQEQRRTFSHLFTPRMLSCFEPAMVHQAELLVSRLKSMPSGTQFDVGEVVGESMLELLERTLFQDGIGHSASEFMSAANTYFNTQGRIEIPDILRLPAWLPRLGRIRARAVLDFFPKAAERVISTRLKLVDENRAPLPKDLVTALIEGHRGEARPTMSEADIAANVITFIGAGYETPANALTWALFLLNADHDWRRRVEEECDQEMPDGTFICGSADRFHTTKALIEEAMRLYPPVAVISRQAVNDDTLAGQHIEAGTIVVLPPWVLHRHRLLWRDPDAFDPSRFLPNQRQAIDRYAYLPFGAGPRVCIGASFAMQAMTITVASIARHMRLDIVEGQRIEPLHRITLRPRHGIRMRASSRSQSHASAR